MKYGQSRPACGNPGGRPCADCLLGLEDSWDWRSHFQTRLNCPLPTRNGNQYLHKFGCHDECDESGVSLVKSLVRSFFTSKSMRWASHSLPGHIVAFGLVAGLALFIALGLQLRALGELDLSNLAWLALFCFGGSMVCGALFWFTVTGPLIARRRGP